MRRCLTLALAVFLATPLAAQVILDFERLALANYDPIPTAYGDGLDVNIPDVQYRTLDSVTFAPFADILDFWDNDYGNLTNVAFAFANGYVAEITFVPAPGFGVTLFSFDMAGWPRTDRANTIMRLVDAGGNVLLDFASGGPVAILGHPSGSQRSSFVLNFSHPGSVRLQWGADWNIGVDNISFQSFVIPEPATWALLSLGAMLVMATRLRPPHRFCSRWYRRGHV